MGARRDGDDAHDQAVKLSDIFKCAPWYVADEEWVMKPEDRACVATELSALAEVVEEAAVGSPGHRNGATRS